jgi:hypothetical protein
MVLILGLVHTPLPQPDFHNIRHHDGAGEVCEHHDHLLRWHPGAGIAADVAVLHWHWFLPSAEPFELPQGAAGPVAHAHVADWQAMTWDDGPRLSTDTTVRLINAAELAPGVMLTTLGAEDSAADRTAGEPRIRTSSATFAPSAPPACLLQRWDC